MSLGAAILLGAVAGLALGILVSVLTDIPLGPRGRAGARRAGRLARAPRPRCRTPSLRPDNRGRSRAVRVPGSHNRRSRALTTTDDLAPDGPPAVDGPAAVDGPPAPDGPPPWAGHGS